MPSARFSPIVRGSRCSPRRESNARLGQREHRRVRRHDDVAGERDLEAASHRDAVDGGDHGLVEIEAARQAAEAAGRRRHLAPSRLVFQIVAGAECPVACPGHDGDPLARIGGEVVEHSGQFEICRRMNGVHHFRPIDGDDGERPFPLDLAELKIGHFGLPDGFWRPDWRFAGPARKAWVTI
jgi:hypothetical protein